MSEGSQNPVLELTVELMRRASVTPSDEGCQELIGQRLAAMGFVNRPMNFGDVSNLWATHGEGGPLFVFAGHTDVVPAGPQDAWTNPPFEPTLHDGFLWGRGAADMKASLAAMVVATERFLAAHPRHRGTLAYLLTSDEEGPAVDGTRRVVETLQAERAQEMDFCVVGEPSSAHLLGDTVRVGRRGSVNARLTVFGTQGHVAYPELAENPVHTLLPALAELTNKRWDEGNDGFPPTGLQVSNIHAGTGAPNVIPGSLVVDFNIRFNTEQTSSGLHRQAAEILDRHGLQYDLEWVVSGEPFLTAPGDLRAAVNKAVGDVTGRTPEASTSGGTSDGRFIAPTGCEVVELGPVNATIHKIDERVATADLLPLADIYQRVLDQLLG
ncbi:MAG TPA: succinyl-diaminopimelate desuccinylase [Pseudomonadales bacterium]